MKKVLLLIILMLLVACFLILRNVISPSYSYTFGPNIKDTNGNVYPSIKTNCGQIWTTNNLKVSHYCNGDIIPQVTDAKQWQNLTSGAWCWYNNDSVNYCQYGKLYNWYAVNDSRGLAPNGWHVPSRSEWDKLINCIDPNAKSSTSTVGEEMKEAGNNHWVKPDKGASSYNFKSTNNSGFMGLPGGFRSFGLFEGVGCSGYWWSATKVKSSDYTTYPIFLHSNGIGIGLTGASNTDGLSVRLIKD